MCACCFILSILFILEQSKKSDGLFSFPCSSLVHQCCVCVQRMSSVYEFPVVAVLCASMRRNHHIHIRAAHTRASYQYAWCLAQRRFHLECTHSRLLYAASILIALRIIAEFVSMCWWCLPSAHAHIHTKCVFNQITILFTFYAGYFDHTTLIDGMLLERVGRYYIHTYIYVCATASIVSTTDCRQSLRWSLS